MKKIIAFLFCITLFSSLYSQDIFLQGKYIEIGIHPSFSFGAESLPPNYYNANGRIGFICDYNKDGWTIGDPPFMGDYFIPGAPEEGWGIEWSNSSGESVNFNNFGLMNDFDIENTFFEKFTTSSSQSAIWKGQATNGNEIMDIEQTVLLKNEDLFFTITTTLKNTGNDTLYSVEYLRNVDPDHEHDWTGCFTTQHFVKYQPGIENNNDTALVIATGIEYGIPLLLGATDSRAKVSVEGFSNRDPDLILDSPTYYSENSPCITDNAICLAFRFENLAPGDSIVFNYFYGLNYFDLSQISNHIICTNLCNDSIANFKLSSYLDTLDIVWEISNLETGHTTSFDNAEVNYLLHTHGQYKISALVLYENNITKNFEKTISIYPDVDLGPETLESTGDVILLSPGNNYQSFVWNVENYNQNYLRVTEPGYYSVVAEDLNGCLSSDNIEITCSQKVKSFDYEIPCYGDTSSFFIFNCGQIKALSWNFGDESQNYFSNEINPKHLYSNPGKFNVELNIYYNDNSNNKITQEIEILSSSNVNLGNDTSICSTNYFKLDAGYKHVKYVWSDNSSNDRYTTAFSPGGVYAVTATDEQGCISYDEIKVIFAPQLKEIETEFATCNNVDDGKIIVHTYETIGNIKYLLDDETENYTGIFEKVRGGEHTVSIVNEDCEIKEDVYLKSYFDVNIPNIFTPNYDNINDFFLIEESTSSLTQIESYEGYIINRYGSKIFYLTDEMNKWDGTCLGKEVSDGVYYYIINFTTDEQKNCIYNGFFHLYR